MTVRIRGIAPAEWRKASGVCPVCKKKMRLGVYPLIPLSHGVASVGLSLGFSKCAHRKCAEVAEYDVDEENHSITLVGWEPDENPMPKPTEG